MGNLHCTQACPVLPAPRASLAGDLPRECSKEKGHLAGVVKSLSTQTLSSLPMLLTS